MMGVSLRLRILLREVLHLCLLRLRAKVMLLLVRLRILLRQKMRLW